MSRMIRMVAVMILAAAVLVAMAPAGASAAKAEVRWSQWKTTEVGEKLMNELKAAFEKENPDITLTLVDSPFTGFHDKAVTLFQAQKLADVLLVQVDWVAEFADLGMLEPLDPWLAKEPKEYMDNIPTTFQQKWQGKQYYLPHRLRAAWRCSGTPRSSRTPGSPGRPRPGRSTWRSPRR